MLRTKAFESRATELEKAFSIENLESIWINSVRGSLRAQPIIDLHDHYDFHINRKHKILTIITSIFEGYYQPQRPIRLRKEKKMGLSRHIVMLQPEDALIIEAIGIFLYDFITDKSKSEKAFFSRKAKPRKSFEDVNNTFSYEWWMLWPEFQERIFEFTENFNFIVVTDIANYYDNIDFTFLRTELESLNSTDSPSHIVLTKAFIDFIFFMIERFAWRPDYLPHLGKGLPQINLEAPRALAHSFLFDVDNYLKKQTNNNFVRWMDDINFGCHTEDEAKTILRNVDEILLSKGLHINSSKSKILTAQNANEHFAILENKKITTLQDKFNANSDYISYKENILTLKKIFYNFTSETKNLHLIKY